MKTRRVFLCLSAFLFLSSFLFAATPPVTLTQLAELTPSARATNDWFGTSIETDWKAGSPWTMVKADGLVTDTGEILECDPPRRILLKWRNEFRPELKAEGYALCAMDEIARGLALSWGVTPFVVPFDMINPENTIETAIKTLLERGRLHKGTTVVVIGSILVGEQIVDAVQMRVV